MAFFSFVIHFVILKYLLFGKKVNDVDEWIRLKSFLKTAMNIILFSMLQILFVCIIDYIIVILELSLLYLLMFVIFKEMVESYVYCNIVG